MTVGVPIVIETVAVRQSSLTMNDVSSPINAVEDAAMITNEGETVESTNSAVAIAGSGGLEMRKGGVPENETFVDPPAGMRTAVLLTAGAGRSAQGSVSDSSHAAKTMAAIAIVLNAVRFTC
jgi:hypothetical protein